MIPPGMPMAKATMRSVLGPLCVTALLLDELLLAENDWVHELWLLSPVEMNSSAVRTAGVFVLSQFVTS